MDFALWAYVFKPEHVHLLIWPRQPVYDMRTILKEIKGPVGRTAVEHYACHAPQLLTRLTVEKAGKVEHRFWQRGGGYDRNITQLKVLHAMIDYIHANPVRRGLVKAAKDWKWSSAGWYENAPLNPLRPDPVDWLGLTSH